MKIPIKLPVKSFAVINKEFLRDTSPLADRIKILAKLYYICFRDYNIRDWKYLKLKTSILVLKGRFEFLTTKIALKRFIYFILFGRV